MRCDCDPLNYNRTKWGHTWDRRLAGGSCPATWGGECPGGARRIAGDSIRRLVGHSSLTRNLRILDISPHSGLIRNATTPQSDGCHRRLRAPTATQFKSCWLEIGFPHCASRREAFGETLAPSRRQLSVRSKSLDRQARENCGKVRVHADL
jgi:hypothetical protein